MTKNPISPPWIAYPGYPPGDCFWRQSGEAWFAYVWKPFWESLSPIEQKEYLKQWQVPEEWNHFYIDDIFQQWLENIDD